MTGRYGRICPSCTGHRNTRAVPPDFFDILIAIGSAGAGRYYRASHSTITRWRRAIGIDLYRRCKRPTARRAPKKHGGHFGVAAMAINRDCSLAGTAADYLRRFGPVHRCDADGAHLPDGPFWRRCSAILTDDELIERAVRLGFAGLSDG